MYFNTFVIKAHKTHANRYNYNITKNYYKNATTIVPIFCYNCNKIFYQTPTCHIHGNGCPYCCNEKISKQLTKWNEENIIELAHSCKTLHEFYVKYHSAYVASLKRNINLDFLERYEIERKEYVIYCFKIMFNEEKYVYVGLTNNITRRYTEHFTDNKMCSLGKFILNNKLTIPDFKNMIILKKCLSSKEARIEEEKYVNFFKTNGYKIINKAKTGSLGGCLKKTFTNEQISNKAKNYKTREEFKKSGIFYKQALERNLLDELYPLKTKKRFFWHNDDNVLNYAKNCANLDEFRKSSANIVSYKLKKYELINKCKEIILKNNTMTKI